MVEINIKITGGKYKNRGGSVVEWNTYGLTDEIRTHAIQRHLVRLFGDKIVPIADYHVKRVDGFPNFRPIKF